MIWLCQVMRMQSSTIPIITKTSTHLPDGILRLYLPVSMLWFVVDVTDENYEEIYSRYINEIIPEMGMRLSPDRCILDYMEPATGIKRLYFPVQKLVKSQRLQG